MLTYAFETLRESEYTELGNEEFNEIDDLYAEILIMGASKQLKQGLYREYTSITENLYTKKGRLNICGTIRNRVKNSQMISCDHDIYSEDNIFNQILKITLATLENNNNVQPERKNRIKTILIRFGNVSIINPHSIKWSSIQFRRNSGYYQTLLTICHYALDRMLLTEESEKRMKNIVDDEYMHILYERFVRNYYIRHYKGIKIGANKIDWDAEGDITNMPTMQSDIMIENEKQVVIIDTKLYSKTMSSKYGDKKTFISNNLYQIYTYVNCHRNNTGKRVSGILLYAMTDEEITPDSEVVISGNLFQIKTLDLNKEFTEISQQLDSIIEYYFTDIVKKSNTIPGVRQSI